MSRFRLTVVISQAQGKHPQRRALEEAIVTALFGDPRFEVSVIPHLYDLEADHPARLFLQSIRGDLVVLGWLYPRAIFWVLDRDGVRGLWGETRLKLPEPAETGESPAATSAESQNSNSELPPADKLRPPPPDRYIYCLDLRDAEQAEPFVAEIQRIYKEAAARAAQQQATKQPLLAVGLRIRPSQNDAGEANGQPDALAFSAEELLRPPNRRWYPVIDYSRCTNCLECLNFCLFGVYSVTADGLIYVNHQDECRKGCPACSRVCPEHAIIFPEYKSPAIAGANVGGIDGLKIDLSKLFGGADALKIAAAERDRELVAAGRQAVGMTVGIPKRQAHKPPAPKDELDKLLDQLDAAEL
ncbi:hypothetical protein HRbin36_00269 [bacterium HR36]|nr:hypothetical protein HRbin36_00269 [bacterium HR36]